MLTFVAYRFLREYWVFTGWLSVQHLMNRFALINVITRVSSTQSILDIIISWQNLVYIFLPSTVNELRLTQHLKNWSQYYRLLLKTPGFTKKYCMIVMYYIAKLNVKFYNLAHIWYDKLLRIAIWDESIRFCCCRLCRYRG